MFNFAHLALLLCVTTYEVGVQPLSALDDGLVAEAQLVGGLDEAHAVAAHLQQRLLNVHVIDALLLRLTNMTTFENVYSYTARRSQANKTKSHRDKFAVKQLQQQPEYSYYIANGAG